MATAADWTDWKQYEQYLPTAKTWEKVQIWILRQSPPETRMFLHSNLPRLFPVRSICQLTDGTEKRGLLAGDSFTTKEATASLNCPGELTATFTTGTSGFREFGEPGLLINSGSAEVIARGKEVKLLTPGYALALTNVQEGSEFSVRQNEHGSLIYCNHGIAEGDVTVDKNTSPPRVLGTLNCRMTLTGQQIPSKRFLFAGEALHPADLYVPRHQLPLLDQYEVGKKFNVDAVRYRGHNSLMISAQVSASLDLPLALSLGRTRANPANCVLYTQAEDNAPLTKAYEFKLGKELISAISLHPGYRKFFLSAVCSEAEGVVVSNLLGPDIRTFNK